MHLLQDSSIIQVDYKGGMSMKISSLQMHLAFGETQANYDKASRFLEKAAAAGSDIAVLPELWNTAFYPDDVREIADHDGVETKAFLSRAAKRYGMNIVGGSVANRRGEKLYNTTFIVDREGKLVGEYDKVHLFSPGREDVVFTAGEALNVFSLDGVTMASVICYDLRFCEWVRLTALAGAKVLFVPAAWPLSRADHWQLLNRARAVENQFFVASCNGCGQSGPMLAGGHSQLIDPWGAVLSQGGAEEAVLTAAFDLTVVDDVRRKIDVFADRRPTLYAGTT